MLTLEQKMSPLRISIQYTDKKCLVRYQVITMARIERQAINGIIHASYSL